MKEYTESNYKPFNCEATLSSSVFTSVSLSLSTIKMGQYMISGHCYTFILMLKQLRIEQNIP